MLARVLDAKHELRGDFRGSIVFFEFNSSFGYERFLWINDSRESKALLGRLEAVIDSSCINGVLLIKALCVRLRCGAGCRGS